MTITYLLAQQQSSGTVILNKKYTLKICLDQVSPRSVASNHTSPRSGRSSGFGSSPHSNNSGDQQLAANIPMKKITRKSRLVSIYDGKPVSDYTERVHFEPADGYEDYSRPNR